MFRNLAVIGNYRETLDFILCKKKGGEGNLIQESVSRSVRTTQILGRHAFLPGA